MSQIAAALGTPQSTARRGMLMVMAAGVSWSLAGPLVRSMEAAGAWKILSSARRRSR